jgi:hypothetical protein
VVRDLTGEYTLAWLGAGALCVIAAVLSVRMSRPVSSGATLR